MEEIMYGNSSGCWINQFCFLQTTSTFHHFQKIYLPVLKFCMNNFLLTKHNCFYLTRTKIEAGKIKTAC